MELNFNSVETILVLNALPAFLACGLLRSQLGRVRTSLAFALAARFLGAVRINGYSIGI